MRRNPTHIAQPSGMRPAEARRAGAPSVYRGKRRVLRRLVIPGALAAIIGGAAIGAAASYLTSQGDPGAEASRHARTPPAGRANPATRPATTATTAPATTAPTGPAAGATTSPAPPAAGVARGRLLNDEGYARIRQGEYDAAIPPLRQAVDELRGAGPGDPYEAYANYNLGYALLQVGDCTAAVPPLEVANRLESSPLVDAAIRRAAACAHQGS
jgi:TolA-binding protein